jgi:hypothetical protein
MTVVLAARRAAELTALGARIEANGGAAVVVPTDLREPGTADALVARAWCRSPAPAPDMSTAGSVAGEVGISGTYSATKFAWRGPIPSAGNCAAAGDSTVGRWGSPNACEW